MKINEKILSLISYGLKPTWVSSLNESQINQLYKRMINKKRLDEQGVAQPKVTTKNVKQIELAPNSSTNVGNMSVSNKGGKTVITQANEGEMTEKAVSKQQQKLMGLALSVKKGDTPKSKVSKKVKDMSKNMSKSDLEDFASTKHKGLPKKVEAKEGGYMDMIGKASNKNIGNKIADIKPSLKWEGILEDEFSQIIENTIFPKMTKKDFIRTILEGPEVLPKPDTKPAPTITPKPDFDPFDDPDPSDDPEAKSNGFRFFMSQVKKHRMIK